ncbi:peptidase inhibitor family I36 protein [Nonomuraea angiospora]|uniref:peptidase inhibitor family I36 protein n=1 Tax=Nonomuraea angiospora TaxID=46172 RepID=UPI003411BFEB
MPQSAERRAGRSRRRKPNAGQAPGQLDSKRCQPGMFCIFADPDFKGDVLGTFGDVANVGVASQRIGGFNINDKATSFWNRTNRTMCLFQDTNFRNPMRWQRPNSNPVAFALKIRPNEFSPNVGFFADDLTTAYGSC